MPHLPFVQKDDKSSNKAADLGSGKDVQKKGLKGMTFAEGEESLKPEKPVQAKGGKLGSLVKGAKRHPTLERGVIVGANACILGGFTVAEGARVGSGAVVTKPVPPGATAVGNPARIIEAKAEAQREEAAARMGFSAYGVTQGDDPVAQAMKGLIDNAAGHEHQIALLWQAIAKLSEAERKDCVPQEAQQAENFDAAELSRLVK